MATGFRPYRVSAEALFELAVGRMHEPHRETMGDIIGRYGISGKRVLGIGPGNAAQEYWLHRAGNELVLVDIDENGVLEPLMAAVAERAGDGSAQITYVVGDAREPGAWLDERYDVVFMSAWTPDELHRAETIAAAGGWPEDAEPLSPACARIVDRGLAEDGLLLILSYASGPDVIRARHYRAALSKQLRSLGLALLEVHCLAASPGVHLVAAVRASDARLAAHVDALADRRPIRALHARAQCDHAAVRVFPGPLSVGVEQEPARLSALLLGASAERLEQGMAPMLARFAPAAATALYAGSYPDSEAFHLLARGLTVEVGPEGDLPAGAPVDLCLLSFLPPDEARREAALAAGWRPETRFFDESTLAAAAARLRPDGVLLYQGRTGGLDLGAYPQVVARMRDELAAAGLVLHEMFVLRAAPGIFLLAAGRSSRHPLPPAPGFRFFAHSMLDTLADRIWPCRERNPPPEGTFFVRPDALARRMAIEGLVERCVPVVRQLVDRFDLAGRSMLSIGPGAGYEEIAMLRCGLARAQFLDIDEHGTLAAHLAAIDEPSAEDAAIQYRLGDFCTEGNRLRAGCDRVGLLYVSSFTPDELRRAEIAGAHRRRRVARWWNRGRIAWPARTSPVHESLLTAIDRDLAEDGVFVLQSFYGGIEPLANPDYVDEWRRALAAHDVHLLEGYSLRAAAGATLWIGQKLPRGGRVGVEERLAARRRTLAARPPLTRFHARAELADTAILQFYPAPEEA